MGVLGPNRGVFRPRKISEMFESKVDLKEHIPYVLESNGVKFNEHFIYSLRLALTFTDTDYQFSPEEEVLWLYLIDWYNGVTFIPDEIQLILPELDLWLTTEIQNLEQPVITTEYSSTHPWVKNGIRS